MTGRAQDFGTRAFIDFWSEAVTGALQAQENATRALAETFKTVSDMAWRPPVTKPIESERTDIGRSFSKFSTEVDALSERLHAFAVANAGSSAAFVEAGFRAMASPQAWLTGAGYFDAMELWVGPQSNRPQLADLWNVERQQSRVLKAWLDVQRGRLEYSAILLDGWLRAGCEYGDEMARLIRNDQQPMAGKALLALWTEVADRELIRTLRSQSFLRAQASVLRAEAELKLEQRNLAEHWLNQLDLPTRTEIDDLHRTVTQLRRELRKLQQQDQSSARLPDRPSEAVAFEPGSVVTLGSASTSGPVAPKAGGSGAKQARSIKRRAS